MLLVIMVVPVMELVILMMYESATMVGQLA
jgi:hypothetical protein